MVRNHNVINAIERVRGKMVRYIEQQLDFGGRETLVLSEGAILSVLFHAESEVTMKELARSIHRDQSTVTYFVNQLEKKGYVTRTRGTQDARVWFVSLTEKGRQLGPDFLRINDSVTRRLNGRLTDEEARELHRLLNIIESSIDNQEPSPTYFLDAASERRAV